MKTGTDTYIQWKQEHYDQDVVKSYNSYICDTLARINTQKNNIPPFPTESLLRIPPTLQQFSYPSLSLGIFDKVNPPPFKKGGEGWTMSR